MTDEVKLAIGKALGKIPSGIHILTTGQGPAALAMLASWVQQAGFNPPAITVAVAKGRPAGAAIHQNQAFVLSILAEGDKELLKKYARGTVPGEDPFAGVPTIATGVGDSRALANAAGLSGMSAFDDVGFLWRSRVVRREDHRGKIVARRRAVCAFGEAMGFTINAGSAVRTGSCRMKNEECFMITKSLGESQRESNCLRRMGRRCRI